jgi:hypothetical protein
LCVRALLSILLDSSILHLFSKLWMERGPGINMK